MSAIHHTSAWAKLARQVKTIAAREGWPCHRCGNPIDYTLSGMHRWGPQVEHTIPATLAPDLAHDPRHLAVSHRTCNQRHGARLGGKIAQKRRRGTPPTPPPPGSSRRW